VLPEWSQLSPEGAITGGGPARTRLEVLGYHTQQDARYSALAEVRAAGFLVRQAQTWFLDRTVGRSWRHCARSWTRRKSQKQARAGCGGGEVLGEQIGQPAGRGLGQRQSPRT
jgi:hypothetical protein